VIFGFWRGFGDGADLNNPVTDPKRSQKSKRPLFFEPSAHRYSFYGNALESPIPVGIAQYFRDIHLDEVYEP
jgi:hypothetical protein